MDLSGVTSGLTRIHFRLMTLLSVRDMTVTELSTLSLVPKSQMTRLIDQLVGLSIVERKSHPTDRRVINVALTKQGSRLLTEVKKQVRDAMRKNLSILTPDELAQMARALETLRDIGTRLSK